MATLAATDTAPKAIHRIRRCVFRTKPNPKRDAKQDIMVHWNVGGTRYPASRDTLTRHEASMLASLLSGKMERRRGRYMEILIDHNGRRFEIYSLDYLRSDRVYVPDLSYHAALLDEFDTFGMDVDASQVAVADDFTVIHELGQDIRGHEAIMEQRRKKIAAMQLWYQLASDFCERCRV